MSKYTRNLSQRPRDVEREASIDEGATSHSIAAPTSLEQLTEMGESTGMLDDEDPDESQMATDGLLVMPWRFIKRQIASTVSRAPAASSSRSASNLSLASSHRLAKKPQSKTHPTKSTNNLARSTSPTAQPSHLLPTTIPHGFQQSGWLLHHRPTVRSAIYLPTATVEKIASLDSHNVNVWRGSNRIAQISTGGDKGTAKTPVAGISRWVYIAKWKLVVIATLHLELKLLDLNFEELTSVSSVKPVLSLEFNTDNDELIAGGVGNIMIWKFRKSTKTTRQFDGNRLVINDLQDEDWVTHTIYNKATNRLFAALDNRIHIYDYTTGARLEVLHDIHDLSISAMALFEPFGYLITASRDTTIKIFNRQNNLVHELRDHTHAVTGLALIPPPEKKKRSLSVLSSTPYFLSTSLDGTIRMWNAELGLCTYCLQTPSECLGIEWMKQDTFFHYAKDRISVWNLNRFYTTFTFIRSAVTQLLRAEYPDIPARILAVAEDGSLRLVSPVTGVVLTMGFPVMSDTTTLDAAYDITQNRVWLLSNAGDIAVYNTQTNPCEILEEWKYTPAYGHLTCLAPMYPSRPVSPSQQGKKPPPTVFGLVCGTDTGQIILIDIRHRGRQEMVVQAHAAAIITLHYDHVHMKIFTSGTDRNVKVWAVAVSEDSPMLILKDASQRNLSSWCQSSAPAMFTVSLVATISVTDGIVTKLSWNNEKELLGMATESNRVLTADLKDNVVGKVKRHSTDDDHTATITKLTSCDAIRVFASSSVDGSVKVWDGKHNLLLREMQFNEPIGTLCFANSRGDLLMGLTDQVVLVRVQDYLPPHFLRLLVDRGDWPDDLVEDPTMFDSSLDFWKLYRGEAEDEASNVPWHVQEKEPEDKDLEPRESIARVLEEVERKREEHLEAQLEIQREEQRREYVRNLELTRLGEGGGGDFASGRLVFKLPMISDADTAPFNRLTRPRTQYSRRASRAPEVPFSVLAAEFLRAPSRMRAYSREKKQLGVTEPQEMLDEALEDEEGRLEHAENIVDAAILLRDMRRAMQNSEFEEGHIPSTDTGNADRENAEGANLEPKILYKAYRPKPEDLEREGVESEEEDEDDMENAQESVAWQEGLEIPTDYGSGAYPDGRDPFDFISKKRGKSRGKSRRSKARPSKTSHQRERIKIQPPAADISEPVLVLDSSVAVGRQEDDINARQAMIRKGMERLGILPNSVLTGSTTSALEEKRLQQERERREKDRVMLSNARAIIERRRAEMAAERRAKGLTDVKPLEVVEIIPEVKDVKDVPEEENEDDPEAERRRQEEMEAAAARRIKAMLEEEAVRAEALRKAKLEVEAEARRRAEEAALEKERSNIDSRLSDRAAKRAQELFERAMTATPLAKPKSPELATAVTPAKPTQTAEAIVGKLVELSLHTSGIGATSFSPSRPVAYYTIPAQGKKTPEQAAKQIDEHIPSKPDIEPPKPALPRLESVPSLTRVALQKGKRKHKLKEMQESPAGLSKSGVRSRTKLHSPILSGSDLRTHPPVRSRTKLHTEIRPDEDEEDEPIEELVPELQKILNAFWFPGLRGKDITLQNIMATLFELLKTGYWSEKCEASDSLLYLYETFRDEFRDPVRQFIVPQLESLNDRDWQVRLRLSSNLVKYGVYDGQLIQALIARLLDPNEDVRKAAMKSLSIFGIDTKYSLRSIMMQLKMLPAESGGPQMDWLDVLLARLRARQQAAQAESSRIAHKWLQQALNPACYGRDSKRPKSSFITLVPPEAQEEAKEFVMPHFSDKEIVAATAKIKKMKHRNKEQAREFGPTGIALTVEGWSDR